MKEVIIVGIVFGSIVLVLAIIPASILLAIRLFKGGGTSKKMTEEARIIQEIYRGLSKLEDRIESLETILLDKEGKERMS